MAFYAGRIVRELAMANPTVVVLTDHNDLDDNCSPPSRAAPTCCASRPSKPRAAPTCGRSSPWSPAA